MTSGGSGDPCLKGSGPHGGLACVAWAAFGRHVAPHLKGDSFTRNKMMDRRLWGQGGGNKEAVQHITYNTSCKLTLARTPQSQELEPPGLALTQTSPEGRAERRGDGREESPSLAVRGAGLPGRYRAEHGGRLLLPHLHKLPARGLQRAFQPPQPCLRPPFFFCWEGD